MTSQVLQTHALSANTGADRISSTVSAWETLIDALVAAPEVENDPSSAAAKDTVRSLLQSRGDLVAVVLRDPTGAEIFRGQKKSAASVIQAILAKPQRERLEIHRTAARLAVDRADADEWRAGHGDLRCARARRRSPLLRAWRTSAARSDRPEPACGRRKSGSRGRASLRALLNIAATGGSAAPGAFPRPAARWRWARTRRWMGRRGWSSRRSRRRWRKRSRRTCGGDRSRRHRRAPARGRAIDRRLVRRRPALRDLLNAQSDMGFVPAGDGSDIDRLRSSLDLLQKRVHDRRGARERLSRPLSGARSGRAGRDGNGVPRLGSELQRPVALKTIRLGDDVPAPERGNLVESLIREAVTVAQFHHSNVVAVFDVEESGDSAFIAMEFVDGVSLDSQLDGRRFRSNRRWWSAWRWAGAGSGARRSRDPSRHQAGEHPHLMGRNGQGHRLRDRRAVERSHRPQHGLRHARIHGAGADRRPRFAAGGRHVQRRRHALSVSDRIRAVRPPEHERDARSNAPLCAAAADGCEPSDSAAAGNNRHENAGEGSVGTSLQSRRSW